MKYFVHHEGQEIEIPAELAASDQILGHALTGVIPGVENGRFERKVEGEKTIITLITTAGPKGGGSATPHPSFSPLRYFLHCKGGRNPIIELYAALANTEIEAFSPVDQVALGARITKAITTGEKQSDQIKASLAALMKSKPAPAGSLIVGF